MKKPKDISTEVLYRSGVNLAMSCQGNSAKRWVSTQPINGIASMGFTLIELLVVVLIIGILAAVALPQYQVAVGKSRVLSFLPIMRSILNAQEIYHMANGTYTSDIDELDIKIAYDSKGEQHISPWGEQRVYTIGDTTLTLYRDQHAVVAALAGVVINMYVTNAAYAECYTKSAQRGEKICKSLGTFSRESSNGYNLYSVHF